MTRALETKAAANLLKNTFARKGAKLSHTEALDILAKLEGYEAWSHRQHVVKKATSSKPASYHLNLKQLLIDRFGAWHSFSSFPREDWAHEVTENNTSRGYFEWLVEEKLIQEEDAFSADLPFYVPVLACRLTGGSTETWNIETDLTDRWGELNTANLVSKPSLSGLVLDHQLLENLRAVMVDEDSFIVCKDGQYGILLEAEYICAESDGDAHNTQSLKTYEQVATTLLEKMQSLENRFFGVSFCVPPAHAVYNGRPTAWAFLPLELARSMGPVTREELANCLCTL